MYITNTFYCFPQRLGKVLKKIEFALIIPCKVGNIWPHSLIFEPAPMLQSVLVKRINILVQCRHPKMYTFQESMHHDHILKYFFLKTPILILFEFLYWFFNQFFSSRYGYRVFNCNTLTISYQKLCFLVLPISTHLLVKRIMYI